MIISYFSLREPGHQTNRNKFIDKYYTILFAYVFPPWLSSPTLKPKVKPFFTTISFGIGSSNEMGLVAENHN
jgi:hypothetical protein